MTAVRLLVIAKDPLPGVSKTRLCPPCAPHEAAMLAEAALLDTLEVVASVPAARHVLVLDGDPGRWRDRGFDVLAQRGDGLDDRLEHAFLDVGGPALLVGMDTPQLTPALLGDGIRALEHAGAVLGPACDGGYWSVGLRAPVPDVFRGVPMSRSDTFMRQRRRLADHGLVVHEQARLRDVDTIEDALTVASLAPQSRFAAALSTLV